MIRNQIQSITQTLSSSPTFIYGTQNEQSGITKTSTK
ncbi:hypothetical protein SAMN05216490_0661 [Mucilaginibacter mallensis]|uniref:Uncharacterized protein n=1 Tax=Mucilaginibacter mallensis TaxID=652787 RepID=A0A1H1PZU2_MUCMA|nr:hypothetical protein SAMN05216490_0661 [Mucilaginibacter mallensis]